MTPGQRFLSFGISTGTLLVLLLIAIRLPFNSLCLRLEYQHPTFPPDEYGFTTAERLHWGDISLQYIFNTAGPDFLANLTFADGSPLFNEREVSHMLDVKKLAQLAQAVWVLLVVGLILSWFALRRSGQSARWYASASAGGWALVVLVAAILVLVAVSFNNLFTGFHRIFFSGNTWLFLYSDTLIRLFPMRLWQDVFIAVGVLSLIFGLAAGWVGGRLVSKYSRSSAESE